MDWPLVDPNDDGIRPAGKPDECLYCRQKVGEPHTLDCNVVQKKVKLRYVFEIEVMEPHFWDADDVEFHRNESSWCADNALSELEELTKDGRCLCNCFHAEFIEVVDATPVRKLREPKSNE